MGRAQAVFVGVQTPRARTVYKGPGSECTVGVDAVSCHRGLPSTHRHIESPNMIRLASRGPRKVKTLAQQHTDFTAEGSPPPGHVATSVPATPRESVPAETAAVHGIHKRLPPGHGR